MVCFALHHAARLDLDSRTPTLKVRSYKTQVNVVSLGLDGGMEQRKYFCYKVKYHMLIQLHDFFLKQVFGCLSE